MDATIIVSASKGDGEAIWAVHRNRTTVHGDKAHAGTDTDMAIGEAVSVTPSKVNHGRSGPGARREEFSEALADIACRDLQYAAAVRARRHTPSDRRAPLVPQG